MKTLLTILSIITGAIVFIFLGYNIPRNNQPYGWEFKLELLDAYEQYHQDTEALLDNIYSSGAMTEQSFTEKIMDTDAYFKYEVARERVDSLYMSQLQ